MFISSIVLNIIITTNSVGKSIEDGGLNKTLKGFYKVVLLYIIILIAIIIK